MTDTLCVVCGRPVADQAYLCDRETRMLAVDLAEVSGLEPELDVTLSRQDRVGESGGGGVTKRAEEPLPYSAVASEAGYILTNTLTTWARHVAEERGGPGPGEGPDGPRCATPCQHVSCAAILAAAEAVRAPAATTAARWLLGPGRHLEWLRHRPEAGEAYDEITSAVGMVRLVIDRHGSRLYAGPCNTPGEDGQVCEADLETRPGARLIRCRTCGAEHDAQHRRDWLLQSAERQLLTATELSRALPLLLGRELNVNTIRTWAKPPNQRLVPHGSCLDGIAQMRGNRRDFVLVREVAPAFPSQDNGGFEHQKAR